jgi:hypothetical protein
VQKYSADQPARDLAKNPRQPEEPEQKRGPAKIIPFPDRHQQNDKKPIPGKK